MEDNYSFFPSEINVSNISSFSVKLASVEEQKICELAEIANDASDFLKKTLDDGLSFYEALCILGESLSFDKASYIKTPLKENLYHLDAFSEISTDFDKSAFCTLMYEYLELKGISLSEKIFFRTFPKDESFVYVKNAFSDEAYDVFSQDFEDPRVRYASNFKEALRLVSDNAVSFCLLPFEERGVRIPTVEELIFRGDYKVNSVIPVFGYDGNAEMKYALVSKNIYSSDYFADDDRYFELRVPLDSDRGLSSLIISAEEFGVKIYRVNTLGFKTEEGQKNYFSVVLKTVGTDFTKLLIYLTVFLPEYIPVGIYKNLE